LYKEWSCLGQPDFGTSIQALGGFSIAEELNMAGSADPRVLYCI
jgi:hypothetical protein